MKVYLAAAYQRRDEMQGVAHVLTTFGHQITSGWVNDRMVIPGPPATFEETLVTYRDDTKNCGVFAARDLADIRAADTVIAFTDGELARGGRHVEFGYAIAHDKKLMVVGPRENIFHTLPQVEWFPNWPRLVIELGGRGDLKLDGTLYQELPIYRGLRPGA